MGLRRNQRPWLSHDFVILCWLISKMDLSFINSETVFKSFLRTRQHSVKEGDSITSPALQVTACLNCCLLQHCYICGWCCSTDPCPEVPGRIQGIMNAKCFSSPLAFHVHLSFEKGSSLIVVLWPERPESFYSAWLFTLLTESRIN